MRTSTRRSWRNPQTEPQANSRDAPANGAIFTVGHSTHPIEKFLELLSEHRIEVVADVRSYPSSRRWPQFNQEQLSDSLARAQIQYQWFKALGGRRHSKRKDSPHTAWQVPAFRSYADYADTPEFEDGLAELVAKAMHRHVAYMCSEGLWWQCHRRIISDCLTVRGWRVEHILPVGKLAPHVLAPFARVVEGRIVYDAVEAAPKS